MQTLKEKIQKARKHQIQKIIEQINLIENFDQNDIFDQNDSNFFEIIQLYNQHIDLVKYYLHGCVDCIKKMETKPNKTFELENHIVEQLYLALNNLNFAQEQKELLIDHCNDSPENEVVHELDDINFEEAYLQIEDLKNQIKKSNKH